MSPECERLVGRKRIRKDVNRLTPEEKSHLNLALKHAMTDPPHYPSNSFRFKDIANYHGAPYLCPDQYPYPGACCPHGVTEFLPWHRLFTGTYRTCHYNLL